MVSAAINIDLARHGTQSSVRAIGCYPRESWVMSPGITFCSICDAETAPWCVSAQRQNH